MFGRAQERAGGGRKTLLASVLLALASLDAVSSAHTWAQANWHTQTFASSLLSEEQLFFSTLDAIDASAKKASF